MNTKRITNINECVERLSAYEHKNFLGKFKSLPVDEQEKIILKAVMLYIKRKWKIIKLNSLTITDDLKFSNRKGDFTAEISLKVIDEDYIFEIINVKTDSKKAQKYLQEAEQLLENIKITLKKYYTNYTFIRDFFTVLNELELSDIYGLHVAIMYRIYKKSIKVYPLFKNLTKEHQYWIMEEAYEACLADDYDLIGQKPVSLFAQSTVQVFLKYGLEKKIIMKDSNDSSKTRLYTKIGSYYDKEICNNKVEKRLVKIDYQYSITNSTTKIMCRTTKRPFDLWDVLAN